ncbi:DUF6893 family small protein [Paractinoplanes brasiliensis]|uniref:Uncharacterized protein n=1 Tax=Paractinoplanes brasiliensis TaxID=52695 RepID=A0A4R6JL91_9ACTN|nr:hypothetical protein C8E87_0476 [Actinoplanes brasiliensis]GID30409.1 hypothetical protein Abr02nite_53920 [Actinoplanes brasiliensis]
MKTLGVITTAVSMAVAVIGAVVLVRSIPDIRRYLKIRTM